MFLFLSKDKIGVNRIDFKKGAGAGVVPWRDTCALT